MSYSSKLNRWPWPLTAILCLILLSGLSVACNEPTGTTPVVVTEVVTREGETVVVTRVVRQTIQVQVTPVIDPLEQTLTLDISYNGSYSNLDPQIDVDEIAVDMMENVYASLTRYNLDNDLVYWNSS